MSTTTHAQMCPECRHLLLYSDGQLMCCWRHCPVYGVPLEEDPSTPINATAAVRTAADAQPPQREVSTDGKSSRGRGTP
jgi:hypothetical protein